MPLRKKYLPARLPLCNIFGILERVFIGNRDYFIINLGIECVWNKSGSDTLNLMRTCLSGRQYCRCLRLYGNDLYIRVLGF